MIRILHNPRCSKSRACLQILQDKGIPVEVIEYMRHPLAIEQLQQLAEQLGLKNMLRDSEAVYKELHLAQADEQSILQAMSEHPQLIQRPIVISGEKMLIARPPEKVLEFIHD